MANLGSNELQPNISGRVPSEKRSEGHGTYENSRDA